jgi:cytosine/adenosine deaminase-related metal-dependent hydrolase
MPTVRYEIVQHENGWAYRVGGTYSETFLTRDEAAAAARRAAEEQRQSGETTGIEYEDEDGRWHGEVASGDDRPETDVEG